MRALIGFFVLTFAASWSFWIGAALLSGGSFGPSARFMAIDRLLIYIGVFAPALVSLALTARLQGREAMRALLGQVLRLPQQARWYVFALGFFPAVKLAAAITERVVTGTWPNLADFPVLLLLPAIAISTPVQAGEEIGWRGYALPRLANRFGLPIAGIVLGVIWACWHLPFFFIPGSDNAGRSFPVYVLAVTSISVAMAWLYWRTGASLFIVMLMHAAIDNEALLFSSPAALPNPFSLNTTLTAWLTAGCLAICAIYFLVQMSRAQYDLGSTRRPERPAATE